MRVQQMLLPEVMAAATCIATTLEKRSPLAVAALVPEPIFAATHAITMDAPPARVWAWIAQMKAGRAGRYSWDAIDNGGGGTPSDTLHQVLAAVTVPKEFVMTSEDTRYVNEFIDSLFSVSAAGCIFDAFVSNVEVNDDKLEAIGVPTLIAHTKDDQLASHDASQRAAERIPGARFISLDSGGHLMIGQQKKQREALARFVAETRVERAAS